MAASVTFGMQNLTRGNYRSGIKHGDIRVCDLSGWSGARKVTGIVGASCAEVTAAIEAQLGHVLKIEQTSEFFLRQRCIKLP